MGREKKEEESVGVVFLSALSLSAFPNALLLHPSTSINHGDSRGIALALLPLLFRLLLLSLFL
jgi:hypothetical protein